MTSRQATRGVQIDHPLLRAMRDTFVRVMPRTLVLRMLDETWSAGPARQQTDVGRGRSVWLLARQAIYRCQATPIQLRCGLRFAVATRVDGAGQEGDERGSQESHFLLRSGHASARSRACPDGP